MGTADSLRSSKFRYLCHAPSRGGAEKTANRYTNPPEGALSYFFLQVSIGRCDDTYLYLDGRITALS